VTLKIFVGMTMARIYQTFFAAYWPDRPDRLSIGAMGLLLAYIAWKMAFTGWVFPLDNFTLAIHEAGHPIVGMLFGDRLMIYGGSLFQIVFPGIFAWYFLREKNSLGYMFSILWEAASLHNLGIYVADARDQILPLAGNGDRIHDWAEILGRWHLIGSCGFLGGCLAFVCWCLTGTCMVLLWQLWIEAPNQQDI